MKKSYKNTNKTFLWITEEWLIILVALLILLAIAIGAASARTLFNPTVIGTPSQTMSASTAADDGE